MEVQKKGLEQFNESEPDGLMRAGCNYGQAIVLAHVRFKKGAINYRVLRTMCIRLILQLLLPLLLAATWSQAAGLKRGREEDAWSLSRAHQQKRAGTAALSTVHTIKDLELGSGGGEVPKPLHFKGLELFLHYEQ